MDFVNAVKEVKIRRNDVMTLYDVVNLYPSIPVDVAIKLVRQWLTSCKAPVPCIDMHVDLTQLCMAQNFFFFRAKVCKQRYGTAMGNSLSSFIAEIFMAHFETHISKDHRFPRVWIRYIDDVFAVLNKPTLDWINSLNESINFTHEIEQDIVLPFLAIKVINNNCKLETDIC